MEVMLARRGFAAISAMLVGALLGPAVSAAVPSTVLPAASLTDIQNGNPAEGLYRSGDNLIVVARYNESSATANMLRNQGLLLLRVSKLMRDYITQRGLPGANGRYGEILLQFASTDPTIVRYPSAGRQLRSQAEPTGGILALDFFDGVAVLEKSRSDFETIDLVQLTHRFKQKILAAGNPDLLAVFAAENGEIIQTIIGAADSFERFCLYTLISPSMDAALDAERTQRIYCQGSNCALPPDLHLLQARAALPSAPAKALVHLMLARLTGDAAIRETASAVIGDTIHAGPARQEFLAVIRECDAIADLPGKELVSHILRNCGVYWAPGAQDLAAPQGVIPAAAEPQPAPEAAPEARVEALFSLLDAVPQQPDAWREIGRLLLSLQRRPEAVAAIHQALLQAPLSLPIRLLLADAYADLQARSLALALYSDVIDRASVVEASSANMELITMAQQRLSTLRLTPP